LLKLDFEYFVQAECSLCCAEVVHKGEITLDELIKFGGNNEGEDYYTYVGDTVELDKIVDEAILFDLPSQFLCREDCKGLCPICGANRNISQCNC